MRAKKVQLICFSLKFSSHIIFAKSFATAKIGVRVTASTKLKLSFARQICDLLLST